MRRTCHRSSKEKWSPTPNIRRMTPNSANWWMAVSSAAEPGRERARAPRPPRGSRRSSAGRAAAPPALRPGRTPAPRRCSRAAAGRARTDTISRVWLRLGLTATACGLRLEAGRTLNREPDPKTLNPEPIRRGEMQPRLRRVRLIPWSCRAYPGGFDVISRRVFRRCCCWRCWPARCWRREAAPPSPRATSTRSWPKVLARRDENWKKLQQYILDERETRRGPRADRDVPVWGERRNYSWFIQDGYFIRSPLTANGVTITEADRRKYEDDFLKRVKARERRAGASAPKDGAPADAPASRGPDEMPTSLDGLLQQTRQPQFIDSGLLPEVQVRAGQVRASSAARSSTARTCCASSTTRRASSRTSRTSRRSRSRTRRTDRERGRWKPRWNG